MEYVDQTDYNSIIDTLISTFGEVLSRDLMHSIVENFQGDLEESANAVMNIVMDGNNAAVTNAQPDLNNLEQAAEERNQPNNTDSEVYSTTNSEIVANIQSAVSYANASRIIKPHNNQAPKTTPTSNKLQTYWTDQLQQILLHHENGACTLIMMRGLPGSGKTYLAKKIIDALYNTEEQHYHTHILSTDDYFMFNGRYRFNTSKLPDAHEWNQNRAKKAMLEGVSPIIIDNTNIELWEMEYYAIHGVRNGYIIEVVEPNTPWSKKVNQLFKRNTHNVPVTSIQRKLDNFQSGINGNYLLKQFCLNYSTFNTPPVLRTVPPFSLRLTEESVNADNHIENASTSNINSLIKEVQRSSSNTTLIPPSTADTSETDTNLDKFAALQQCLNEMEKVEKEWENGDNWGENSKTENKTVKNTVNVNLFDSKPQRQNKLVRSGTMEKFLSNDEVCQDWSKCSMFLPPWGENSNSTQVESSKPVIEMRSISTCIEYGELTSKNPFQKIIICSVPRDINEYTIATSDKKIPQKWMLDKSTSTYNDQVLTKTYRCQYEKHHFKAFRRLFRPIARSDLRDIFEKCCGDVNWAVEIVMDGMASNKLESVGNDDHSDTDAEGENDNIILCNCLSAYDIIPYYNNSSSVPIVEGNDNSSNNASSSKKPKSKKENVISESSMQLKRQIEQNVVISDNHYSEHCLKIRKLRRGESLNIDIEKRWEDQTNTDLLDMCNTENNVSSMLPNLPSTSKIENDNTETTTDEEHSTIGSEEIEQTVNIHLGKGFVSQLDEYFGRCDMDYPSRVIPKINMPISLLHEINALWMESLMSQLEEDAKQSEIMLQQDEEFARQLAMKEAELLQSGTEPEVPDFKEIMDMDFALSLYHKDVAEWRNNLPDDLAAKLTRDKICNLFPEMSKDILSELLMAHDNNFEETVEALLISTGKSDILEAKNGISKFVMDKEMERHEKLLEERKAVLDVEWPLLPPVELADMSVVQQHRDEAERHLQLRNKNYQKAQDYIRRGITQVATHYNEVAAFHKRKYELSNSMAAAALMQIHAANSSDNATIDLHYLRVGEARESLDLFLDTHIQELREMHDQNGVRYHTLFFITGRGLHSNGRPRIKPAVKRRLLERGLISSERNPGLLTSKVCAGDKLSHEVA